MVNYFQFPMYSRWTRHAKSFDWSPGPWREKKKRKFNRSGVSLWEREREREEDYTPQHVHIHKYNIQTWMWWKETRWCLAFKVKRLTPISSWCRPAAPSSLCSKTKQTDYLLTFFELSLLGLLSDKPPSHSIGRDLHIDVNDHLNRRVQGRYLFWLSASHVKREIFSKWRKKNEIIDLTTFTIRIASIEKEEKKGNECGRSKSRVLHGSRRGNSFLGVNYPKFPIQLLTRIIFHSRVLLNSLPTTSRFIF